MGRAIGATSRGVGALFQLVLQFAPWDSARFDDLIALEEKLIAAVGSRAMDAHDAGSGEANIFLLTEQPTDVLRECLPVVQQSAFRVFAAGYRDLAADDEYQRVWPQDDGSPFEVK